MVKKKKLQLIIFF